VSVTQNIYKESRIRKSIYSPPVYQTARRCFQPSNRAPAIRILSNSRRRNSLNWLLLPLSLFIIVTSFIIKFYGPPRDSFPKVRKFFLRLVGWQDFRYF